MSNYKKNAELYEKLKELTKEYDVSFWTAQQKPTGFVGRTKLIELYPKSGYDIIILDHQNLIGE